RDIDPEVLERDDDLPRPVDEAPEIALPDRSQAFAELSSALVLHRDHDRSTRIHEAMAAVLRDASQAVVQGPVGTDRVRLRRPDLLRLKRHDERPRDVDLSDLAVQRHTRAPVVEGVDLVIDRCDDLPTGLVDEAPLALASNGEPPVAPNGSAAAVLQH